MTSLNIVLHPNHLYLRDDIEVAIIYENEWMEDLA